MRVKFRNVSFAYEAPPGGTRQRTLKDLDLTFETHETIGLVGLSGAGKSSLLSLIAGLEKPTSGTIEFEGEQTSRPAKLEAAVLPFGLVFQNPEMQLFLPSVREDIGYGLSERGLEDAEVDRRVRAAMQAMGLPYREFARRHAAELSQGEQRRAAIACMFALEPLMLILDEPTAGLDDCNLRQLLLQLEAGARRENRGLLIASHDMEFLVQIAQRFLVLQAGELVADFSRSELLSHRELLLETVGLPRAVRLAELLRTKNVALPHPVLTDDELLSALGCRQSPSRPRPGRDSSGAGYLPL